MPPYYQKTKTTNGITFTVNTDGSIGIKGTATATADFVLRFRNETATSGLVLPVGDYALPKLKSVRYSIVYTNDGGKLSSVPSSGQDSTVQTFSASSERVYGITLSVPAGITISTRFYPVICTAAELQTATIADSLRAVSVSSGGTYTDDDGQQWIADELAVKTDGTGEIVRRVNEAGQAMTTPVTEKLDPTQISAVLALKTFKPTTVISNTGGAMMAVSYIADTKNYIDKKIAEIAKS